MATLTHSPSITRTQPTVRPSRRPWWRWLLTALAFPPAGLLGSLIAGPVDSLGAAVVGGLVTGAGIGAAQWALLRHRSVGVAWIAATSAGLAAGVAAGAALVSYRVDRPSLVLMGAVSGLGIGLAQGATMHGTRRALAWGAATCALWTIGWTVMTSTGIGVDEQWVVFGAGGALTVAFLQSTIVTSFVPAPTAAGRT
jgi:hypothetical protein